MIAIGCDRAGYGLKRNVEAWLDERNIPYTDYGCGEDESCDYPLIAAEVCKRLLGGEADRAILICGTGIGISMAANKFKGIRAAVCTDTYMAKYTRLHNDANVLCLGGRVIGAGAAAEIVDTFLNTGFEGGRHQRRVDQIAEIENNRKED